MRVLVLRGGGRIGFSNVLNDEDPVVLVEGATGSDSYGLGRSGRSPAEHWAMPGDVVVRWPGGSSVTAKYGSVSVTKKWIYVWRWGQAMHEGNVPDF